MFLPFLPISSAQRRESKIHLPASLAFVRQGRDCCSKKNVYFLPFKDLVLPRPELEFTVANQTKDNLLYLTVTSKNFAKGVHVNCNSPYNFSDNFFDLPINGVNNITLPIDETTDIEALMASIKIRSLWSSRR